MASKDEEITRLKNHNQDLIKQIKKLKREKISHKKIQEKFHQKEVDLHKEFNKNLLEKMKKIIA